VVGKGGGNLMIANLLDGGDIQGRAGREVEWRRHETYYLLLQFPLGLVCDHANDPCTPVSERLLPPGDGPSLRLRYVPRAPRPDGGEYTVRALLLGNEGKPVEGPADQARPRIIHVVEHSGEER
jgi:hypothetical protein